MMSITGPFTRQKTFGMARIQKGLGTKKLALLPCLHILFSTVLSDLNYRFGAAKRLNTLASVHNTFFVRMHRAKKNHGGREVS